MPLKSVGTFAQRPAPPNVGDEYTAVDNLTTYHCFVAGTWVADASASAGWQQGGNSFGATGVLGTNDNFNVEIRTNGSTKVTITTAGNIVPGTDAAAGSVIGTSTLRWADIVGNTHRVFAASGDANPTASLLTAALAMGAGGASALDVRIRRTGAGVFTIDNNGAGAATVVPATDSQNLLGTATLRWSDVVSNTHRVFAASGDANASAQLSTGAVILGVGGATALDTRMRRTAAATITLDNNSTGTVTIVPAADSQNNLGTATLRWSDVVANTHRVFAAAADANPTVSIASGSITMGVGGGTAVDARIRRLSANAFSVDNNSTAGFTLSTVSGSVFFESTDGAAAAVSGAATGRIRYNNTAGAWQVSTQTGAYSSLLTAASLITTAFVQGGNSFGATAILGTNDAFDLNIETNGAARLVFPQGTFNMITQGAGTLRGTADNQLTIGTSAQRCVDVVSILFRVFTAAGDANPSFQAESNSILFGPGGGTALDTRLARTGVGELTLDPNGATTQPTLFVTNHGTVTLTPASGSTIHTSTSGGVANNITVDTYDTGNVPTIISRRARGTAGAPSAVINGDELSAYSARGYGTTGFSTGSRGRFVAAATETWTDAANGTRLNFWTTPNTTIASVISVFIDQDSAMVMNGNFNWRPNTDSQGNLGTATFRWADVVANTHRVFAAASDANPTSSLLTGGLVFGAGGASALDLRLRRTAASTLTIDNNSTGAATIVPATTNTGVIGTDALKWNRVRATTVVTGDLEMQDEGRNAHWVLREETDRIVALNKITGKRYEMSMKEIK